MQEFAQWYIVGTYIDNAKGDFYLLYLVWVLTFAPFFPRYIYIYILCIILRYSCFLQIFLLVESFFNSERSIVMVLTATGFCWFFKANETFYIIQRCVFFLLTAALPTCSHFKYLPQSSFCIFWLLSVTFILSSHYNVHTKRSFCVKQMLSGKYCLSRLPKPRVLNYFPQSRVFILCTRQHP